MSVLTFSTGTFEYSIDRTSEKWDSWEEWCEKVVWWCNKKGAYLYECITIGYPEAPMEQEAITTQQRICQQTP